MKTTISGLFAVVLSVCLARTEQISTIVLPEIRQTGGLPEGWQVKVNHGIPEISVVKEGRSTFLALKSHKSSYAVERGVDVDPTEYPMLHWRWKVTELPKGADFRRARTDDQAAQVLLAFADKRVLTYIWDSSAPKGTMQAASSIPLLHIFAVVCESGGAEANRWLTEARNVAQDYERAYGHPAPHVRGLRLQINSQHTGTSAESWFGEVAFRRIAQ